MWTNLLYAEPATFPHYQKCNGEGVPECKMFFENLRPYLSCSFYSLLWYVFSRDPDLERTLGFSSD